MLMISEWCSFADIFYGIALGDVSPGWATIFSMTVNFIVIFASICEKQNIKDSKVVCADVWEFVFDNKLILNLSFSQA